MNSNNTCHKCDYTVFELRLDQTQLFSPPSPPQGAVVGLAAGLAMAFWIGIGSFVMRMSNTATVPPLNTTALPLFDNMTTTVMTTLLSTTTAKPR